MQLNVIYHYPAYPLSFIIYHYALLKILAFEFENALFSFPKTFPCCQNKIYLKKKIEIPRNFRTHRPFLPALLSVQIQPIDVVLLHPV